MIPTSEKRNGAGAHAGTPWYSIAGVLAVAFVALLSSNCNLSQGRTTSANPAASSAETETKALAAVSDRLPAGTRLHVRLLQSISSASARPGDHFDAELSEPVEAGGIVVLPQKSRIRGRVAMARPSGRLSSPGVLQVTLDSVQTPDGKWHNLETTSVTLQASNHKKRNATLIGGGAGLGGLIGGIAGGGKGLAIGALSGAGAGTVGAAATGKKDVGFAAERTLIFTTKSEALLRS